MMSIPIWSLTLDLRKKIWPFSLSADENEDWDWIVCTKANKQTKTPHPTEMEISPLSLRAVHTSPKYSDCIR